MTELLPQFTAYAAIGAAAGFFAGLLGIGGGVIIAPLLVLIFSDWLGFSPAIATHLAIATSAGVIALTAPVSAAAHARRGNINYRLAGLFGAAAAAGAYLGANGALALPAALLQTALAAFLLISAATLARARRAAAPAAAASPAPVPHLPLPEIAAVAASIGAASAMLGIGGGALAVPYLQWRGVPIRIAIGIAAAAGAPLALGAALGYVLPAPHTPLPPASAGYLYLPALAGIAAFSVLFAPLGARASGKLPTHILRRIFAVLAAALAIRLLLALPAAA